MDNSVRILSTRPLDAALIGQAAEKGIVIDALPFISTQRVKDEALVRQVRELAGIALAAVFTSTNAVEAVAEILGATPPVNWKVFCIGAATRQLVEKYFGEASVAGVALAASALADVILRQTTSGVFFFCGDQRRDELPDKLSAAGVRVNECVVYRTLRTPQVITGQYNGIAFFSPSAVESFFSVNTVGSETLLFAIGQTTARSIRIHAKGNPVITGNVPDKETLVQQMIDYFQKHI